ncbi:MAG: LamG-like jellyroll fold domain-containing protein, partial [Verrucomicrobiales bacterium]
MIRSAILKLLCGTICLVVCLSTATRGQVVLSEFLADNHNGRVDEDGDHSDWIEVSNTSGASVSLHDWSLTDSATEPRLWEFPAITLDAGERLVVFASNKNRSAPDRPLHTNFRLSADGEYLALVRPDVSIATEFAPAYPPQLADISFGLASRAVTTPVVTPASPARVHVPTDGTLGDNWWEPGFNDSGWQAAVAGVGFETGENEHGAGVAGAVIADGPLVYWRFSESSGALVTASGSLAATGQVLNGTALGQEGPRPPTWPGFESGNAAARFDGVNDKIDVPANPAFNPPSFTIEAWAKPAVAGGTLRSVVTCRDTSPTRGFAIYSGENGRWQFWLGNGATWTVVTGPTVVAETWAHVVGTYESGTQSMRLFVNGVEAAQTTSPYSQNTVRPLRIGAGRTETAGGYFFHGDIDEVALFDRALSAEDIGARSALAATGTGGETRFHFSGLYTTNLRESMHGINSTAYVRVPFVVPAADQVTALTLRVRHDDGLAVWLNGALAATVNAPATLSWNAAATAVNPTAEAMQEEVIDLSSQLAALRTGANTLAIQGLNVSRDNPDFLMAPRVDVSTGLEDGTSPVYFTTP